MKLFTSHLTVKIYLAVLFSAVNMCYGSWDLDSLLRQSSFQNDDTCRVKTLLLLGDGHCKTNPQLALTYCDEAFLLSKKINFNPGIIDAYHEMGRCYQSLGYFDSALIVIRKAIKLSDSTADLKRYADNTIQMGNLVFRTEGPRKANPYYLESKEIYQRLADSAGIANSLNGLGVMLMQLTEYDSAIRYFLDYLRICQSIDDRESLGKGYVNLGLTYFELGDLEKAGDYYLKSIIINEEHNNQRYLGSAYNNLGAIAYEKGDYDTALKFYKMGLLIDEKLKNLPGIADRNTNIGNIYLEKNDLDAAFSHYSLALDIYHQTGQKDGMIAAYKNQGWIFYLRGNYRQALRVYDSCLVLAELYNLPYRSIELYWNIFTAYEKMGNYKLAFENLVKYYAKNDSVFTLEKEEIIAHLTLEYEKEKDQAQILALQNENLEKDLDLRQRTNQRNIYLASGSVLVLALSFLFVLFQYKSRKDKIISEQKIVQLEEEKKLLAARAIVEGQEEERKRIAKDLHDGLGVILSTVKMHFSLLKEKSPDNKPLIEKASKLLEQATGDVRRISHNMMPGLLTKLGLYEAAEELFDKVNEIEGLEAHIRIEGEQARLPENTEIMLYRIIQEMVNNTIKHANAKNLVLSMEINPGQLLLKYSDDGTGFNVDDKLAQKSIGLSSIQSRVSFLNGTEEIESSEGNGVTYTILVPV
ncbi:MAG: tetratricopeptide repeat protein [Bacteroidales bacterium]